MEEASTSWSESAYPSRAYRHRFRPRRRDTSPVAAADAGDHHSAALIPTMSPIVANYDDIDEAAAVAAADVARRLSPHRGGGGGDHHAHPGPYHRSAPSAPSNSTASVVVFAFALSGILLVFLLFYFLARVCSPSDEELKDGRNGDGGSRLGGGDRRRASSPRKMASGVQEGPRHVLYPRRIYELQAEEGCYTSLPSMQTPEMADDVVVLKRPEKRHSIRNLVRKLTTSSTPSTEHYVQQHERQVRSAGESPRLSTSA